MSAASQEMRKMIMDVVSHLIDVCPDDALPLFVTKDHAKQIMSGVVAKLSGPKLAEMSVFTFERLEALFNAYGRDYIRSRAQGGPGQFKDLEDALEKMWVFS